MASAPASSRPSDVREARAVVPSWGFLWALEIRREDGSMLTQVPLAPDWEPAREWLRLLALRRDGARGMDGDLDGVQPLWHETLGGPLLRGFRAGASGVAHEFSFTYFGEAAHSAARRLVDEGRLAAGERFRYLAVAHATTIGVSRVAEGERFSVEVLPAAPRLIPGRLAEALASAVPHGEPQPGELPVLVPGRVLADAARLARGAGDLETGGILLGHLHHDASEQTLFVEVTALIDAPCTRASAERLTFTADTWAALRGVLALRGRGELMVGWFHSHPAHKWCRDCPPEARRRCRLGRGFLSPDDRVLHRTVFPAAWSVALLVTVTGFGDEVTTLFGWDEGTIEKRGFHVLPDPEPMRASLAKETSDA